MQLACLQGLGKLAPQLGVTKKKRDKRETNRQSGSPLISITEIEPFVDRRGVAFAGRGGRLGGEETIDWSCDGGIQSVLYIRNIL